MFDQVRLLYLRACLWHKTKRGMIGHYLLSVNGFRPPKESRPGRGLILDSHTRKS